MIIFGFRTSVTQLAVLAMVCSVCGNSAGQALLKRTTKFSLFFIPLFPVRTRYVVECGHCGTARKIDKSEARRLGA